jgi:hypothetical protein
VTTAPKVSNTKLAATVKTARRWSHRLVGYDTDKETLMMIVKPAKQLREDNEKD